MARKVAKKPAKRSTRAKVAKTITAPTVWRLVLSMAGGEQIQLDYRSKEEKELSLSVVHASGDAMVPMNKNIFVRPTHVSAVRDVGEVMVPSSQV